jgi:hypothetical protein
MAPEMVRAFACVTGQRGVLNDTLKGVGVKRKSEAHFQRKTVKR